MAVSLYASTVTSKGYLEKMISMMVVRLWQYVTLLYQWEK